MLAKTIVRFKVSKCDAFASYVVCIDEVQGRTSVPRTPSLTSSTEPPNSKSPSTVLTLKSYNLLLQYSSLLEAFIKMADDEDKLVTKPFKFVTGKCSSLRSLSAVDTDVHGSRSAPSALTFLRNTWTEASYVHGSVTDQCPMPRLRCAIP